MVRILRRALHLDLAENEVTTGRDVGEAVSHAVRCVLLQSPDEMAVPLGRLPAALAGTLATYC